MSSEVRNWDVVAKALEAAGATSIQTVSYTHLTLPTKA